MIRLLFRIYGYSYDALVKWEQNTDFDEWVAHRKKILYAINLLVLSYISRKFRGRSVAEDSFRQQFCMDAINKGLTIHYRNRLKAFAISKKVPFFRKEVFSFTSLLIAIVLAFKDIGASLVKCRHIFSISGDLDGSETEICIGFPYHSFSYNPNGFQSPKSFAEFLLSRNQDIVLQKNLISIDEYHRPSKKFEEEKSFNQNELAPSDLPRKKISIDISFQKPLKAIYLFLKTGKRFFGKVGKFNIFLLADYLNQFYTDRRFRSVFDELLSRKIQIKKIYPLAYLDLGLLKYDTTYQNQISVFSYAQNYFMPPSAETVRNVLEQTIEFSDEMILEESDLPTFSFYSCNSCGFSYHAILINHFKSYVNRRFDLVLPVLQTDTINTVPVNIGYERIKTVETDGGLKTILFFDVPAETDQELLTRTILGDKTAKNVFIHSFYSDIMYLAEKYNCRVYLKPKYSLSSPKLPDEYKSMIESFQNEMGHLFSVLDPYCNIRVAEKKIDLMISFPFTSTYYSMADICERSVYYVSDTYRKSFTQTAGQKLVLGRSALEDIFKQL